MYLGGGSTITFDTNYVRAVGTCTRGEERQRRVQRHPQVRRTFDASEPRDFERMLSRSQLSAPSVSGYDSAFRDGYDANGDGDLLDAGDILPFEFGSQELWSAAAGYGAEGVTVMTGQHGVGEAVTPEIGSIQLWEETAPGSGEYEKGYYHANAGLAIVVHESGRTFTATDAEGNDVTEDIAPAVTLAALPDMRQSDSAATNVPVIEIDIAALSATGHAPGNGLLYAAHEGMGTGTDAKGVLLTNGAELPTALTVASEGPVYVHGDYNTVDKKGAAVIGDAINLLSNAWDGTKSPGSLPRANETTFNFAMITRATRARPTATTAASRTSRDSTRSGPGFLQHLRLLREHLRQPVRDR